MAPSPVGSPGAVPVQNSDTTARKNESTYSSVNYQGQPLALHTSQNPPPPVVIAEEDLTSANGDSSSLSIPRPAKIARYEETAVADAACSVAVAGSATVVSSSEALIQENIKKAMDYLKRMGVVEGDLEKNVSGSIIKYKIKLKKDESFDAEEMKKIHDESYRFLDERMFESKKRSVDKDKCGTPLFSKEAEDFWEKNKDEYNSLMSKRKARGTDLHEETRLEVIQGEMNLLKKQASLIIDNGREIGAVGRSLDDYSKLASKGITGFMKLDGALGNKKCRKRMATVEIKGEGADSKEKIYRLHIGEYKNNGVKMPYIEFKNWKGSVPANYGIPDECKRAAAVISAFILGDKPYINCEKSLERSPELMILNYMYRNLLAQEKQPATEEKQQIILVNIIIPVWLHHPLARIVGVTLMSCIAIARKEGLLIMPESKSDDTNRLPDQQPLPPIPSHYS